MSMKKTPHSSFLTHMREAFSEISHDLGHENCQQTSRLKQKLSKIDFFLFLNHPLFNRPGVAGAVLQTPSLLTD